MTSARFTDRTGSAKDGELGFEAANGVGFIMDALNTRRIETSAIGSALIVHTPDGDVPARIGDWIVEEGGKLKVRSG